jgi:hypothetical protein
MTKNILVNLSLAATMTYVLVGCQAMPYQPYARDVKKKPQQGGVIALKPEHREEDSAKARQMMASNCATLPVKVLEEGEVAVGQETKSANTTSQNRGTRSEQVGSLFGLPISTVGTSPTQDTSGSSTVTSIKEWQISYECETPAAAGKSTKR